MVGYSFRTTIADSFFKMDSNDDSAPQLLFRENDKATFRSACEVLLRLANNVLDKPNEQKYRRIRIANPLLESKLLPVTGGMECLFEMGFEEVCKTSKILYNFKLNIQPNT